ncbi:MAG: SIMPL domain-containing protein [Candidatus Pacebacteria bacterium]|nr:SIMPL domain-containing protein [Candidatus Paceibacterota bacterium]
MESQTKTSWLKALGLVLLAGIIIVSIIRDRIVMPSYNQVSVTGTGKVEYVPDTAHVTLGVHIEGPTAQNALAQLNTITTNVIPAVEALGIPKEKISTQNLSVYPQYYYPEFGPSVISGYTADQQLTIKISTASSSADIVGQVIQAASSQGANQVQSVTFDVSNLSDLKQQAVIQAIADARSRAQTVADAAGVKLGDVIGWWENPISVPGQPVPYYSDYGYGGDMAMGEGMSVPAGTSELIMEVSLNYETK